MEQLDYYLKLADAVVITDENHRIICVNEMYEKVTGFHQEQIHGSKASFIKSGLTPPSTYFAMKRSLAAKLPWSGVFINKKKDGSLWHSHITISPIEISGTLYYIGIFRELDQLSYGVYFPENRKNQLQTELLSVIALSAEMQDPGIEEHLFNVQMLTKKLIYAHNERCRLGLPDDYIHSIINCSILHDIGKSGIPEAILYKPGPLLPYERKIVEMHPIIGRDLIRKLYGKIHDDIVRHELTVSENIILFHHEKWDGTGYPQQMKGQDIPFEARIISIVDVYDALTSKRPYKDAWSIKKAFELIREQRGKHFDPEIADTFVELDL